MKSEIIIAGYGGQGILSMGKILAYAAMMESKEVTWMPAYGPEQRGGTANVTVIISEESISSPILSEYDIAIILNQASLFKFEQSIKPGGILIYDPSAIVEQPQRKDITIYSIAATETAIEMRNPKAFNMIVLGALLQVTSLVNSADISLALRKTLPARHHHLLPQNEEALQRGMDSVTLIEPK